MKIRQARRRIMLTDRKTVIISRRIEFPVYYEVIDGTPVTAVSEAAFDAAAGDILDWQRLPADVRALHTS